MDILDSSEMIKLGYVEATLLYICVLFAAFFSYQGVLLALDGLIKVSMSSQTIGCKVLDVVLSNQKVSRYSWSVYEIKIDCFSNHLARSVTVRKEQLNFAKSDLINVHQSRFFKQAVTLDQPTLSYQLLQSAKFFSGIALGSMSLWSLFSLLSTVAPKALHIFSTNTMKIAVLSFFSFLLLVSIYILV